MARLYIPEPKIKLYEDGFEEHDKLDRKTTGDKLSDLVERIDDPLVIALDGAWGSGKSVFLKCWVGEHLKRKGNTTQTVYFDAFQHDYLDDPLIALTSAISERFEKKHDDKPPVTTDNTRKFKKAAWAIGKGVARVGVSAVTFGATEILSDMGDEVAEAVGEEAKAFLNSSKGDDEAAAYWAMQRSQIAAMKAFQLALTELTEPDAQGLPTRKLVIVIDELDRCRPDYALSLLEIIKHCFNVDGVHFVLGVNLNQLQNSVKARYGAEIDAERYLQKFITIQTKIGLHRQMIGVDSKATVLSVFEHYAETLNVKSHFLYGSVLSYIRNKQFEADFSLRAMRRMFCAMVLTCPPKASDYVELDNSLLAGLLVLQAFDPSALQKVRNMQGEFLTITPCLSLADHNLAGEQDLSNIRAWSVCYASEVPHLVERVWGDTYKEDQQLRLLFGPLRVKGLLETCIDVFELPAR